MPKEGKYSDIVTGSVRIRDEVKRQMAEAGLTQAAMVREIAHAGHNINPNQLSRYLNYGGVLPQRDVMVICLRLGIVIKVDVFLEDVNRKYLKQRLSNAIKKWKQDLSQ
jgi:transposase-like protein